MKLKLFVVGVLGLVMPMPMLMAGAEANLEGGVVAVNLQLHVFEFDDQESLSKVMETIPLGSTVGEEEFAGFSEQVKEGGGVLKMSPRVQVKLGQRAKVEMIHELVYPTAYDPPEMGEKGADGIQQVTPANPTAFDVRNVGLTWEVEPSVLGNNSVELSGTISHVQFLGFFNFGSVIKSPEGKILTENRILQPVFRVARITTNLAVQPGRMIPLAVEVVDDAVIGEAVEEKTEEALEPKSYLYLLESKLACSEE